MEWIQNIQGRHCRCVWVFTFRLFEDGALTVHHVKVCSQNIDSGVITIEIREVMPPVVQTLIKHFVLFIAEVFLHTHFVGIRCEDDAYGMIQVANLQFNEPRADLMMENPGNSKVLISASG